MAHLVIIGGGIAGLTAANTLANAGSIILLEQSHAVGGRAKTFRTDGGYNLNLGTDALIPGGIAASTFREWGIRLSGGDPAKRAPGIHHWGNNAQESPT